MNGQFVFYVVDAASHRECGAASTLLVRALFHDYLRNLRNFSVELKDLAEIIERESIVLSVLVKFLPCLGWLILLMVLCHYYPRGLIASGQTATYTIGLLLVFS